MKKRTIKLYSFFLVPLYVLIFFVIGLSLVAPIREVLKVDFSGQSPVMTARTAQVTLKNDCKLQNGVFIGNGADPFVVINCSNKNVSAFTASFVSAETDAKIMLYYDTGDGFKESNTVSFSTVSGEAFDFARADQTVRRVRFDFEDKLRLDKVDFYDGCVISYEEIPLDSAFPPIIAAASVILSVLLLMIEGKTRAVARFFACVKKNARPILIFIIGICSSAIIGAVLTYLAYLIKHRYSIYLFVFLFGAVAVAFEILFFSRTAGKKAERLFLAVCLTLGTVMILITPIGHASWDTGVHYRYALSTTASKTLYTRADWRIMSNTPETFPALTLAENESRNALLNSDEAQLSSNDLPGAKSDQIGGELKFDAHLAHFCSGVALKLAKFLRLPFVFSFMAGKVPNLLIYAFVCYFAIKKLRSGKMILSVIALFPTALFLATNYSYDYWVICFSFLGLAYYYSEVQEPLRPISAKDTYIMFGALFLACIPKAVYLTLLLVPLFMPLKKIPYKLRYYMTCLAAFALLFGLFYLKASASVSGGGDMRGGGEINSSAQLAGILADPLSYTNTLLRFLKDYFSFKTMGQYIHAMAYLDVGGKASYYIFISLIILLGVIDKNGYDRQTSKLIYKAVALLFMVGTAGMIATALYIDFTPVKATYINGCQARYLIPIILPVCFTFGSFRKYIPFFERHRASVNTAVFSACSFAVLSDIYLTTLLRMI